MPAFGVDLSDYDHQRGPVDVAAMARDGIVFLTHKATEGTSITHRYYAQTLNAARAAGIGLLGAYMVVRTPGNGGHGSIGAQVSYFLSYLDGQTPWWRSTPGFFLQVDTEHWGYDNVDPTYGAQACALLRQQTGKWVIHYVPRWAYGDTVPGSDPLWASAYGSNPAVPYRQAYPGDNASGWAPYSGRTPTFLQYGSKATIGTQPGCDVNAYRGSLDQLRALITGTQPPRGRSMIQVKQAGGPTIVLTDWATWCDRTLNYDQLQAMLPAVPRVDVPDAVLQRILALPQPDKLTAQTTVAPSQDQVNTAMNDPAWLTKLGAAVASHIHVS